MGKRRKKPRPFTAAEVQLVLRLLAEWTPLHDIVAEFENTFGRKILHGNVQRYRDSAKWRPEIERLRTALVNRISDIPIASKFWRLRARQRLFEGPLAPTSEQRQLLLDAARETGDLSEKRELTGRLTLEQLVAAATEPEAPGE